MAKVIWSPAAQVDLDDIWEHSFEHWGLDQADDYIEGIRRMAAKIVAEHVQRRRCDHIRQGYFKATVGSHILFYVIVDTDIDVKRILHQAMEFQRHL